MKRINPFSALQYRDFCLLWFGLLISAIGSQMQIVAIIWHVYTLTKSPLSLGLIGLARFLPLIFFAFIGGIAADKFRRSKILIFAQIIMGIVAVLLTIVTYTGHINSIFIYIMLMLNSIAAAFDSPARQSLTPLLVPKKNLMNAMSLNTLLWQSSLVIGPSLAGFVIAASGVGAVYLINAISFVPLLISLLIMKTPPRSTVQLPSFSLKSLKEGVHFIRQSPMIYSTMILDFFATFFASATVLLPIFAKDILLVGPQQLGILYAAPSIGAVMAGFIFSSFHYVRHQGKILVISVIIYGLATILFGLSRSFYLSLLFLGLGGIGDVISTILRNTIRQIITPDHLRGRMLGINMIFFMGGPQLGEVEAGMTAAIFGAPLSVILGGVGTIVITAIMVKIVPQLLRYQGEELTI